ncbi:MAG: hypothetical protein JWO67_6518 [Streptosporangiaceae bacterium]|jgi:glucose-6-phosphate isomerase|nr:hypothetical protein [Streptosporangiaceae bacterium]
MTGFATVSAGDVRITARGAVRDAAERTVGRLWIDEIPVRLASEDRTLWQPEPQGCWPAQPGPARALLPRIGELVRRAHDAGLTEVVVLGRGPQARAADLISRAGRVDRPAPMPGRPAARLTVLDGTDPGPLLRLAHDAERLLRTIVIVIAQDPGTDAQRRILARMLRDKGLPPAEIARRFVLVGRPGGALAELALAAGHTLVEVDGAARGHGQVFGALSPAALLPAALAGVDVAALLDEATQVLPSLTRPENNPGLVLGAILGGCARTGRDKVVLGDFPARLAGLGAWVAPLLTGATQGGLLPILQDGGLPLAPADDLFQIILDGRPHQDDATVCGPLGAQLVVWEYAAAVAAYLIGADPFAAGRAAAGDGASPATWPPEDDQAGVPRPAFTVGAAAELIEVHADEEVLPDLKDLDGVLRALMDAMPEDGYFAVMAYMDPDGVQGHGGGVRRLAATLAARCSRPVLAELRPFQPAFPNDVMEKGVFLILTGNVTHDAAVPDKRYRLSELQLAEALGAVRALTQRDRPVVRLHLQNRWTGITTLLEAARGGA